MAQKNANTQARLKINRESSDSALIGYFCTSK